MFDERCFDLSSGQPVAGDVDDIVDSSPNPVVALVVTCGAISSELSMLDVR